jgi:hypothetical protein
VEPVDIVAPRDRESIDGLGGRGPVAGVEAAEEVIVAVGEAIDGMRPESEIERLKNLTRKRIVTAVPQFTIVVRFLVLLAWHPRQKVVEMSLRGRFVHRQNFSVEVEVAPSVAVLRPTVPVNEEGTLAVDLVLDDLVGDTARDEGVESAGCRSELAQTGASALEVLSKGAAHPRQRRRERKDPRGCPKNAASPSEVRRVGSEMDRDGSSRWPSDRDGVEERDGVQPEPQLTECAIGDRNSFRPSASSRGVPHRVVEVARLEAASAAEDESGRGDMAGYSSDRPRRSGAGPTVLVEEGPGGVEHLGAATRRDVVGHGGRIHDVA